MIVKRRYHPRHRRAILLCSCLLGWERGYGVIVAPSPGGPLCPRHGEGKAPRTDHLGRSVAP